MTGTIKKGLQPTFGFVKGDDGTEYFFHRSHLADGVDFDELTLGAHVRFDPARGQRGPYAENLELLRPATDEELESMKGQLEQVNAP